MALTSLPGFARRLPAGAGPAREGAFGAGGLGWAAGVGQADLAAGGEGAVGLTRLLLEESAAVGRRQEPLVDLALVEGAGGDQVVEVAGRFPQLAVARPDRGGGDPGELLGQCCPRVAFTRVVGGGRELDRTRWPLELPGLQPLEHHRWNLAGWGVQVAARGPLVGVAAGVAAGWGDHIAATPAPVHMLQPMWMDVAQAGGGQIEVPAATAGADQRPRALQAIGGGQFPDGVGAGGAVDIQHIKGMAGGEADVGVGVAGPPGQHPRPVGGGVLDPMGDQAAQGVLAGLAAARIPTRAAGRRPGWQRSATGEGLEVAVVGEGVVQGQHRDAAGGIAERGVTQLPAGPAHGVCSSAGGRWRCRKLAALLRPQPAASARVRAVHGWPSGRGWA
jgi:hypothetical protein